ncbi:MAG: lysophospholipid acyltransferase family protein [bacterium]
MNIYREIRRKITRTLAYRALLGMRALARVLSRPSALRLGAVLGELGFWLTPRDRRICRKNLDSVFKNQKSGREKREIALGAYRNLGKSFFEVLQLERYHAGNMKELVTLKGEEHYKKEFEAGRRVIFCTGHIGNWELLPFGLCVTGCHGAVMARRVNNEGIDRLTRRMREHYNVKTIVRDPDIATTRKVIRQIKKPGELFGIVMDQDTKGVEGIFVDFLGKAAFTMTGPVSLALITGASLIPSFVIRQPDGHNVIEFHPAVRIRRTRDKAADIRKYTAELNRIIGKVILSHPDQWIWMHRRWKQIPPQG